MSVKIYPDLQKICRLCLKKDGGTVFIFNKDKSDKYGTLSIPMRIMSCAALEVQDSDDFPKKICTDCRLQLEKSYYFRKLCQTSDTKLRKLQRLVGMDKVNKVFIKKIVEDDEVELEFKDSLDFIKEQEDKQKQCEKLKLENIINEIKLQNEKELENTKKTLKLKCQEELRPLIIEEVKKKLRAEMQNELEQEIREQCLSEAKDIVRNEVREECRQIEIQAILKDLKSYLTSKTQSFNRTQSIISNQKIITPTKKLAQSKRKCIAQIAPKIEVIEMGLDLQDQNVEKEDNLSENITEEDLNTIVEESDGERNFSMYDTDEEFDIQKKVPENFKEEYHSNNDATEIDEYEDEEFIANSESYTKINVGEVMDTSEELQETTTTSYRIEDNENGEIHFLKKSDENLKNEINEENMDQTIDENIMIINFPENVDNEYAEEFEEKYAETEKLSTPKSGTSPNKNSDSDIPSSFTTIEATFLTKTYVNPMQRCTDTPKIFKCDDCPMVFSTKHSIERHLRTHKKVKKMGVTFQCPECRIVVSCSSALRRHMYVHCEEKPFLCNVCGKTFVQKEILKRHMQIHTGVKPHQCPHCNRAFGQRVNLTQHINLNHLQEPRIQQHSCHLCPKRFNHASGLSRHLAVHNGVAFQCSECNRTFADRSSIKRHISNMHGNGKVSKSDSK